MDVNFSFSLRNRRIASGLIKYVLELVWSICTQHEQSVTFVPSHINHPDIPDSGSEQPCVSMLPASRSLWSAAASGAVAKADHLICFLCSVMTKNGSILIHGSSP